MQTRAPVFIMCDETDSTANRLRYNVEQQQRKQQPMSKDTSGSKAPLTLLHLPLVLVCDIIEHIVHSYTSRGADEIFPLLRLRRVNKFFDVEVTHHLGRSLRYWNPKHRTTCIDETPSLAIRLLQACIGENDRRNCEFATRMHSVVDALMQQFELVNEPKKRHEMLGSLCYALTMWPWRRDLFKYGNQEQIAFYDPLPTAFAVAIMARYTEVMKSMVEPQPAIPCDIGTRAECSAVTQKSRNFVIPLDIAITLGNTDQVMLLLSHGAVLNGGPRSPNCLAMLLAAQHGHLKMVEFVLEQLPWNSDDKSLRIMGKITQRAAAHQRWDIVRRVLDRDRFYLQKPLMEEYWNNTLCSAARYGRNDIVSDVLDLCDRPFTNRKFPLGDAACGGHVSTCRLLLEKDVMHYTRDIPRRSEVLARCVARSGSVELCRFLKQQNLWKPWHEVHFLPIAAENGHLEFAKYAVKNGCDAYYKPTRKAPMSFLDEGRIIRYPDDIRYFSLLRAIVSGHQDFVRWLVEEIGMDVGRDSKLAHPQVLPMNLAIAANNNEMAALLSDLSADPQPERFLKQCGQCQKAAIETLELYRTALYLRTDYSTKWIRIP